MNNTPPTVGLANPPRPENGPPDKPAPERIAEILLLTRILASYGRHLAAAVAHRAVWRGFATVAQFFGTAAISLMIARIHRGILRAVALERVLLRRAKRGRDLKILAPRIRATRTKPAPQPAETLLDPPRASRLGQEALLTPESVPTLEQLEQEVRRRPIGRTLAAICLDLGISPSLCTGPFWNRLFDAILDYRGNLAGVVAEMHRRRTQFEKDDWRYPGLPLPDHTKDGIRRALGFFIGEPPVDPFQPAASPYAPAVLATGPP